MSHFTQMQAGAPTPARQTRLVFDAADLVPQEPFYSRHVDSTQVQWERGHSGVLKMQSGMIILKPVNDMDVPPEKDDQFVFGLSNWEAVSTLVEEPRSRELTELTGLTAGTVIASGNNFLKRRVPATGNWGETLPGVPDVYGTPSYAMIRGCKLLAHQPHDQGYLIRCVFTGAPLATPDYLFGFEFGGPLVETSTAEHTGYGRYYLSMAGDGKARLHEYIDDEWEEVAHWRYGSPRDLPSLHLVVRILPHGPRYLEVTTGNLGGGGNLIHTLTGIAAGVIQTSTDPDAVYTSFPHVVNNRTREAANANGLLRAVTGRGPLALDIREDLLAEIQVSKLVYPTTGTFTDRPFALPVNVGSDHVARLTAYTYNWREAPDQPFKTQVGTALLNATSGAALAQASETVGFGATAKTFTGFVPPGGQNLVKVSFTLQNDETAPKIHTPSLGAYEVTRYGHYEEDDRGEKLGGTLRHVSLSGAGYQPEGETAGLLVEDEKNELEFLRARGLARVRLETTWDAADQTKYCTLFSGATGRVTARRRGKAGMVYPSAEWRALNIEAMGEWYRFMGRFFLTRHQFDRDPDSTGDGDYNTWKITEIVRRVLEIEGVPPAQIDIADDGLRLAAGAHSGVDNNLGVSPGTASWAFANNLLRTYLNAWLIWDGNAGPVAGAPADTPVGMMRVLRAPLGTETPVYNFAFGGTDLASVRLAHYGPSHGASTSVIDADTFESWVVPPEGNVLTVSGGKAKDGKGGHVRLERQIENATSWDRPGRAATADDDDPDYLGRVVPIEYVDLGLGDGLSAERGQALVDFIARRIWEWSCRGQKWVQFESDLALIDAAALEPTIYTTRTRRPLRAGDTITVNGERFILHSVTPQWDKDHFQRAVYQAQLYRGQTTYG